MSPISRTHISTEVDLHARRWQVLTTSRLSLQTTSISIQLHKMHISSLLSTLLAASVAYASPTPTEKRTTSCSPVGISAQSSAQVVSAFKSSGVVAELIPSIAPKVAVKVAYGSKQVNLGNKFKTTGTCWPKAETLIP